MYGNKIGFNLQENRRQEEIAALEHLHQLIYDTIKQALNEAIERMRR